LRFCNKSSASHHGGPCSFLRQSCKICGGHISTSNKFFLQTHQFPAGSIIPPPAPHPHFIHLPPMKFSKDFYLTPSGYVSGMKASSLEMHFNVWFRARENNMCDSRKRETPLLSEKRHCYLKTNGNTK